LAAVEHVASALNISQRVTIPEAARARAAAIVITAAESGNLHFADVRKRPKDFDPTTRDHFLSGTLVPANWVVQAQRFRQWYRLRASELFVRSTSSLRRQRRALRHCSARNM